MLVELWGTLLASLYVISSEVSKKNVNITSAAISATLQFSNKYEIINEVHLKKYDATTTSEGIFYLILLEYGKSRIYIIFICLCWRSRTSEYRAEVTAK